MASEDRNTRLPKFSFGFRRAKREVRDSKSSSSSPDRQITTNIRRSASPVNPMSETRSAPPSNQSSPKINRSKSLRLPGPAQGRSKFQPHSPISDSKRNGFISNEDDDDMYLDTKTVQVPSSRIRLAKSKSHTNDPKSPRGRSKTISHGSPSSNPNSRSASPSSSAVIRGEKDKETGMRTTGRFGFSHGGSDVRGGGVAEGYGSKLRPMENHPEASETQDQTSFARNQRRTQSFNVKPQSHVLTGSHDNATKLAPPSSKFGRNHISRRSKTPTPTNKSGNSGSRDFNSDRAGPSSGGSLSKTSPSGNVNQIKEVEEGNRQKVVTRRDSSETRGKRPISLVGNKAPDLNKFAKDISSEEQPETKTIPTKSVRSKIPHPGSIRSQSALGHTRLRHTPSPTESPLLSSTTSQASQSAGSSSSNDGSGMKSYEQATISSSAKKGRPGSAASNYKITRRQGSFGSQTNLSTPSTNTYRYKLTRGHSATSLDTLETQQELVAASVALKDSKRNVPSTPLTRSTPSGSKKGKDSTDSGGVTNSTPGVSKLTSSGLPPRTPYRVARTMVPPSGSLAGMNELEGSVLLEADDYLRVCHDVKALKTVLLRLKRELQTNAASDTPTSSTYVSTRGGKGQSTPLSQSSGPATVDLKKKLQQVTSERNKALEEVTTLKKETKKLSSRVSSLTSDLTALQKEQSTLKVEFKQVEGHRDRLLDKVERLHADKHKLEDRLTSFEKARIYEQTISESWLEDVDGYDDSIADLEYDGTL